MPDPERPLLGEIDSQVRHLAGELREMSLLRWQLARIEFKAAADHVRRLAIVLVVAVVMVLTSLPLLAVSAAELLDGRWGISRAGWLALMAGVLLAGGALVAIVGWRWFRRHFAGFRETAEELREDLVWLQEWTGKGK
jgi:hypothetical protein